MSKNNPMKEKIFKSAKILFYDQGYTMTTTAQIAEKCNTSKGSLAYYYKTKPQLCVSVFRQISQEITTIVEKRFDKFKIDHNPQIETAVEFRIEGKMYEDDKVLRCYNELYADGGLNFSYDDETSYLEFYKRHNDAYNLNLDQGHDELKKICICAVSASDALLMAYYNGHLSHSTLEDVVDDQIRNTYRLMKIPENRIEEIVEESKKIEKIIDIQYLPYFEFE